VIVRAVAEPAVTVLLDAMETGRVDEVAVKDGALVEAGNLLFRLSNPQRQLELVARQSDLAQQFSNLASMRVQYESARSEYRRRLADLRFALEQAERAHNSNAELAARGFISQTALDDSKAKVAHYTLSMNAEQGSQEEELRIKREALAQMEQAIAGLNDGVRVVSDNVDALAVRAPIGGRLTSFSLQVGASLKPGDRIGRIDEPTQFKLVAQMDEFYLSRVAPGLRAHLMVDGQRHVAVVSRVNSQVKDGRFTVELSFEGDTPPRARPGQSLDCSLTLGEPRPALLLPQGAFVNDTGGAWAFVLDREGRRAERRQIKLGRRNSAQLEVLAGLAAGEQVIVSSYSGFGSRERLTLMP
jgi:HlyD family secretion protein